MGGRCVQTAQSNIAATQHNGSHGNVTVIPSDGSINWPPSR